MYFVNMFLADHLKPETDMKHLKAWIIVSVSGLQIPFAKQK